MPVNPRTEFSTLVNMGLNRFGLEIRRLPSYATESGSPRDIFDGTFDGRFYANKDSLPLRALEHLRFANQRLRGLRD
jgi:hypothetical protein